MTASESAWSVPENKVLQNVRNVLDEQRQGVLATVVDVEGNAYRRPGAKMVITPDGNTVGGITAGCLEDEVVQVTHDVLDEGQPRIETYDLMEDDDVWGLGVGCNGIIDVLLEPLDEKYQPVVDAYEQGKDIGVITVLDGEIEGISTGSQAYYHPNNGFVDADGEAFPNWLQKELVKFVTDFVKQRRAATVEISKDRQNIEVFIDSVVQPPELVVVGTGRDVGPVVELASKNGFRVTVVGFRGANASDDRFPDADAVLSTSPANIREAHGFSESTYVVVMTHNFIDDRFTIDELVKTRVPYIGLMGPRSRFEEMLDAFAEKGQTLDNDELDRVYTPIGLDLGGGSPYQIAHSIVAEVLAVHNDRDPRHLKERAGPIHDRVPIASE